MNRKLFWNLFKYLLAFGLLAFVIWKYWQPDSEQGLAHVWNKHIVRGEPINGGWLALAAAILAASVVLTIVRWYILVIAQGLPFTLRNAFRLGLAGFFFNSFLPGSVGGDLVKATGMALSQRRRTVAVATVIMDRVIALWGLVWFVALLGSVFWALGLVDTPASHTIIITAGVIVALSGIVWLGLGLLPPWRAERFAGRLAKLPKVGASAAEFWRAVWMYRCRQRSVALALVLSWIGQVGFVFVFYCCVRTLWDPAVGSIPTVTEHFLLVPVGLVIQAAPLFPGGAGIGEAGFGGLYSWFGCAAAIAVLGSLVQRVLFWMLGLAGYFVYLSLPHSQPADESERQSGDDHFIRDERSRPTSLSA